MPLEDEFSTVIIKPRPLLADMPDNVKRKIAENTDISGRITLRKVSTHFRAAVEASSFNFGTVIVDTWRGCVKMSLQDRLNVEYRKHGENDCEVKLIEDGQLKRTKIIEGEDFEQRATKDFGAALKGSKCFIKQLKFLRFGNFVSEMPTLIRDQLDTFRKKLHVVDVIISDATAQEDVVRVVRNLQPGFLKSIFVGGGLTAIDQIVNLEQWKYFTSVQFCGGAGGVPISSFLHLNKLEIRHFPLTQDNVEELVQTILQRPHFEKFIFWVNQTDQLVMESHKQAVSQYSPPRNRIPIPGTTDWLRINHHLNFVTFERKKEK